MRPRLCLYLVGQPPDPIAAEFGRFEDWFRRLAGASGALLEEVDGLAGYVPDLDGYAGVVVTGSPASLTAPEPWMEAGVELVRACYGRGTPLLGVCFGHQLVGAAFGGGVIESPGGWELSSHGIELTEHGRGDPLFEGVPDRPVVNFSHQDAIDPDTLSPMNGVTVLARNAACPVQAIAAGPAIRGVQFHPEFDGPIAEAYAARKRPELPELSIPPAQSCPDGERVFANFLSHWVL